MDTALDLKQKFDLKQINTPEAANDLLYKSALVKALLSDFEPDVLNLLNRLTQLAEIPFTNTIDKVQQWIEKLVQQSYSNDGFSITGKSNDILACYNAMITSILIKLKYTDTDKIAVGINWMLNYQSVQRDEICKWEGTGILKYGGCMKATPCYIGVVKSMISLSNYKWGFKVFDNTLLNDKLQKGLKYILEHEVYLRKSNGMPITKDITKLTFPFSYKTNIIEILRLLKENDLDKDERCNKAKEYLKARRKKDGFWKANKTYLPKNWIAFDKPGELGHWMSYEIEKIISD